MDNSFLPLNWVLLAPQNNHIGWKNVMDRNWFEMLFVVNKIFLIKLEY